jgi:outer membrane biosynthesis protein TonB
MDPNQQTQASTEPILTQTQEPSPETTETAPATHAEAPPTEPEPQQTTEPQSTTEPEPEPTEPEPATRVVPKPSEYELPEGAPDNLRIFAHEQGFTQDQLNASLTQFGAYMHGMRQTEQTALRQAGEAHLKNWGPDAKNKLALAKAALRQNDPEGKLLEALNTSGYGNHPDVLNFLYNIGKSMQEGGFIKSTVPRKKGDKTLAEAMFGGNHPTEG